MIGHYMLSPVLNNCSNVIGKSRLKNWQTILGNAGFLNGFSISF